MIYVIDDFATKNSLRYKNIFEFELEKIHSKINVYNKKINFHKHFDLLNQINLKQVSLATAIDLKNDISKNIQEKVGSDQHYELNFEISRHKPEKSGLKLLAEAIEISFFRKKEKNDYEVFNECIKLISDLTKKIKHNKYNLKQLTIQGFLHLIHVKEFLFMVGRRCNSYCSGDEENNYNTDFKIVAFENANHSIYKLINSSKNEQNRTRAIHRLITRFYQ